MEYGLVVASEEQLAKMTKKELISCVRTLYSLSDRADDLKNSFKAKADVAEAELRGMKVVLNIAHEAVKTR